MGGSIFGSSSDQTATTNNTNSQQNVSDQGVALRGQSGNTTYRYRLGRGASLQLGLSGDEVTAAINAALAKAPQTPTTTESGGGFSIGDLLGSRFALNASTASDAAAASNPLRLQWILIGGVALVGLVALVVMLKRRKG